MSRVLLVEDEEHLALGMRFNLENAGYEVLHARTAEEALVIAARGGLDLLILDVMLRGDRDGFEVAKKIRRGGSIVPILMLTARDGIHDRVAGLDAGADDYVTKPFDLDELMARVRGLLRRQVWSRRKDSAGEDEPVAPREASEPALPRGAEATAGRTAASDLAAGAPGASAGSEATAAARGEAAELVFGACRVDFRAFRARTHDGEEVELSPKEAAMMRYFAAHEGEVVSRSAFLEEVWHEPGTLETRTVDNFILRLRKLFEPDPRQPRHILSVRGIGYRFVR